MKKIIALLAVFGLMTVSVSLAQHGHGGHKEGEGLGKLVFKGEKSGVSVKAWLNDIESALNEIMKTSNIKIDRSKMDPNLTHHIAVAIEPNQMNGQVKKATLKLTLGKETKEYPLMSMHGHYGSDVAMAQKGTYKAVLLIETQAGKVNFTFDIKN